jgi:hypothetical protein
MRWCTLVGLLWSLALSVAADGGLPVHFGTLGQQPIAWEATPNAELSSDMLRLTKPGTSIRSLPLELKPLELYRVHVKLARGPGSVARLSITYLDAQCKPREWQPAWQHKGRGHPNWQPLSPRAQHYVQGFVLPRGAHCVRLQLQLDGNDDALASYHHATLTQLSIEAERPVVCCERVGADLLLNGQLELPAREGLPSSWSQWSLTADNHVERIQLPDEPARSHVLRVKPGTTALLASSYLVAVTPGSAYRLSLLARGKGRIELDIHSLSSDRPTPLRVGNNTREPPYFDIQTDQWTKLSQDWIAEAPNVASAQAVITVNATAAIEVDAIELRPYE